MTKPVLYLQTDSRWKNLDYSAKGEKTTIGASGCGPTAMAMVLATWADKSVTPVTECAWALSHGYKAPHQGTYYGYFAPAAARYGLKCRMLNGASIYGKSSSAYHAQAKKHLESGGLVIACMGKGNWTSSGHFVLVYDIQGDTIYINDPASTATRRTMGSYALFRQQVKYYFLVDAPKGGKKPEPKEDELDMTIDEMISKMTNEQAYTLMQKAQNHASTLPEPVWSQTEGHWARATADGTVNSGNPEGLIKRDELIAVLGRKGLV